jgi:hypothetical protein
MRMDVAARFGCNLLMRRGDEMSYSLLFNRLEEKDENKYTSKEAMIITTKWNEAVTRLKESKVDLNRIPITRGDK